MREIFPPKPQESTDPGRVFYTIRPEDKGKRVIETEIGKIPVWEFIGYVMRCDVGKRLYRVPNNAGDYWFWQMENHVQYENRIGAVRE